MGEKTGQGHENEIYLPASVCQKPTLLWLAAESGGDEQASCRGRDPVAVDTSSHAIQGMAFLKIPPSNTIMTTCQNTAFSRLSAYDESIGLF